MISYFILSNLILLLFFGFYQICLRKLTFFDLNRWYLLISVLAAHTLPLPFLFEGLGSRLVLPLMTLEELELTTKLGGAEIWTLPNLWREWLSLGYWFGAIISLLLLIYRVVKLLTTNSAHDPYAGQVFFKRIWLGKEVRSEDLVAQHERLHVCSGHSYDLLFVELAHCFNWWNPLYFYFKKELKLQHEYWVDGHFSDDPVVYAEKLVAYAMRTSSKQFTLEFSNQSILKQRITMLFGKKSRSNRKTRYLLIIPLAVFAHVVAFAVSRSAVVGNKSGSVYSFTDIDQQPEYPGGYDAFREQVAERIHAADNLVRVGERIEVSFVVDQDGQVCQVKAAEGGDPALNGIVVRAVSSVKSWKPARLQNKPVSVRFLLPITVGAAQNGEL